jgi:hypothetical protein
MDKKYSGGITMALAILALAQRLGGYENRPLAVVLVIFAGLFVCFLGVRAANDFRLSWQKRRTDNRRIIITGTAFERKTNLWPLAVLVATVGVVLFVGAVSVFVLYPRPEFRLSLLGGNIFVPDKAPELTGIALDVRINNIGTPSIAANWNMFVEHGHKTRAQLTKPPEALTLRGPAGMVLLHASESLERKAMERPLRDGDSPLEGWLLFYVPLQKSVVQSSDTVLHLTVEDSKGHTFSAKQRMGEWLQR